MSDLINTTEMYLRTILELEEEGIVPLRARIAERLHQSGPTVSQTVARMERDQLLSVSGDRHIELSEEGRRRATSVMRKHRLAERLLIDVIGLEWEYVHDEACQWEHVMSDNVVDRLVDLLGDPIESPYGNPIPGREAPSTQSTPVEHLPSIPMLLDDGDGSPLTIRIRRIGENLQTGHQVLAELHRAGIIPGVDVLAQMNEDGVLLSLGEAECQLDMESAEQLYAVTV